MIGKINSGGLNIHGIVEEYKVAAGENVRAGDFVSFTTRYCDLKVDTLPSIDEGAGYTWIKAVVINQRKVLVLYYDNASKKMYARVVIFKQNQIIEQPKEATIFGSTGGIYDCITVDQNRVLVIGKWSDNYRYMLIRIEENNDISFVENGVLPIVSSETVDSLSAILIKTNKVLITKGSRDIVSHILYFLDIGQETVTIKSFQMHSNSMVCHVARAVLLEENKIFYMYSKYYYDGSIYKTELHGALLDWNEEDNSVTVENDIVLMNASTTVCEILKLSKDLVLLIYSNRAHFIQINGNTIDFKVLRHFINE